MIGLTPLAIGAVRGRLKTTLTDHCDVLERQHIRAAVGENVPVFAPVADNVPCRFITSLLDTRNELEDSTGGLFTQVERYRVAFAHDAQIPSAGQLRRDGKTYQILTIREAKTDDAQVMVFVTRVRE